MRTVSTAMTPGLLLLVVACSRPNIAITRPGDSEPPTDSADSAVVSDSEPRGDTAIEQVGDLVFEQIPVLIIDTGGQEIGSDEKIDAHMAVVSDHDGSLEDLDQGGRTWDGPIGIELHGSSSAGYPKTGYRFETRNDLGSDLDYPLLGLPSESDWVLHGPYSDKTLIRNALAYTLGAMVAQDTGAYQPRVAFCELILNEDYRGVYLLVERVKRSAVRVDLPAPAQTSAAGDITGGYLVRIDQNRNEGWTSAQGTLIDYADPRDDEITAEQDAYIKAWFDGFEAMLLAEGWDDPDAGYPAWIVPETFVDHFIVNELAKNIDAYRLSAYLFKEPDADGGRLHAGPLWDFDRAWGNVNYCDCQYTEGWIIDGLTDAGYSYQYPFWWLQLLEDPAFQDSLRCRWEELRRDRLSDEALLATIDDLAEQVRAIEPRDDARWETIGTNISPNWYVGESWDAELDYLRSWLLERSAWLEANIPGSCGA
jgi:hypothetical protein